MKQGALRQRGAPCFVVGLLGLRDSLHVFLTALKRGQENVQVSAPVDTAF